MFVLKILFSILFLSTASITVHNFDAQCQCKKCMPFTYIEVWLFWYISLSLQDNEITTVDCMLHTVWPWPWIWLPKPQNLQTEFLWQQSFAEWCGLVITFQQTKHFKMRFKLYWKGKHRSWTKWSILNPIVCPYMHVCMGVCMSACLKMELWTRLKFVSFQNCYRGCRVMEHRTNTAIKHLRPKFCSLWCLQHRKLYQYCTCHHNFVNIYVIQNIHSNKYKQLLPLHTCSISNGCYYSFAQRLTMAITTTADQMPL